MTMSSTTLPIEVPTFYPSSTTLPIEKTGIDYRKEREALEKEMGVQERTMVKVKKAISKRLHNLQERCPHENTQGAQYTRWCVDCGKDWDTT
jgi:hypothetical protein